MATRWEPAKALPSLFDRGHAWAPEDQGFEGPAAAGLWWRNNGEVVATPALLRLAAGCPSDGERVGLLLACERQFRGPWLDVQASRLGDLGRRGEIAELCREISALGTAANTLRARLRSPNKKKSSTSQVKTELALFGAPADQAAAAPGLLRVLSLTAPRVEGSQAAPTPALTRVDPRRPEFNWAAGRLIQAPTASLRHIETSRAVLRGTVAPCVSDRMGWVLSTPWITLLGVLAFTAEAWAAERQGGIRLELAANHLQQFARPPEVQVVVTLGDGREILCGTLGELCSRTVDALGMALVPSLSLDELNQRLADVIAELLRAEVWSWRPEARTHYVIGEAFSFDCYRGEGHRHIFLGAESLSQILRSVAVAWAHERVDGARDGAGEAS